MGDVMLSTFRSVSGAENYLISKNIITKKIDFILLYIESEKNRIKEKRTRRLRTILNYR